MDTSQAKPTAEQVKKWDGDKLLGWIKKNRPTLLKDDQLKKFEQEDISGNDFLDRADGVGFFKNICGLTAGASNRLAKLAKEFVTEGKTAGIKSKFTIFIHAHYKLTSQETDSRPKMWRCPIALVSPPTTHLCCSLYANPYYCRAFNSHIDSNHQSVCPLQIASKVDYGLPSRIPLRFTRRDSEQ